MIYLQKLSPNDGMIFYDLLQDIEGEVFSMHNEVHGKSYDFYKTWLSQMNNWDLDKDLPDGYVRQTTYWLMKGEKPIGICRLRHRLTASSRKYGGSFGYSISPKYRKRGYGNLLVQLILSEAKKLNIHEIISMVACDNIASNKIMLKNKGELFHRNEQFNYYRF